MLLIHNKVNVVDPITLDGVNKYKRYKQNHWLLKIKKTGYLKNKIRKNDKI